MAKQMITMLTDDLDGSEADESVTFAFDGHTYEIDLSAKNARALREFLQRYTAAATRTGRLTSGHAAHGARHAPSSTRSDVAATKQMNQAIRVWAAKNGYPLAERGRIPQHIVDAYHKGVPNRLPPSSIVTPSTDLFQAAEQPTPNRQAAPAKKTAPRRRTQAAATR